MGAVKRGLRRFQVDWKPRPFPLSRSPVVETRFEKRGDQGVVLRSPMRRTGPGSLETVAAVVPR